MKKTNKVLRLFSELYSRFVLHKEFYHCLEPVVTLVKYNIYSIVEISILRQ